MPPMNRVGRLAIEGILFANRSRSTAFKFIASTIFDIFMHAIDELPLLISSNIDNVIFLSCQIDFKTTFDLHLQCFWMAVENFRSLTLMGFYEIKFVSTRHRNIAWYIVSHNRCKHYFEWIIALYCGQSIATLPEKSSNDV